MLAENSFLALFCTGNYWHHQNNTKYFPYVGNLFDMSFCLLISAVLHNLLLNICFKVVKAKQKERKERRTCHK